MTKSRKKRVLSGVMGTLSSVAELVTKNFWLKVLSLAIAMVIYVVLRPEAEEKPILPYVNMNVEKAWSEPAHSVIIESETHHSKTAEAPQPKTAEAPQPKTAETPQPKTAEAPQPKTTETPQPPDAVTNDLQHAGPEPKGNNNENDGKRQ